jgi:hypothetical protein
MKGSARQATRGAHCIEITRGYDGLLYLLFSVVLADEVPQASRTCEEAADCADGIT